MTRTDHLLWVLAEECNETAQRCSKAARFSLAEVQPGYSVPNSDRITVEFYEAVAAYEMLVAEGAIPKIDQATIDAIKLDKRVRVESFLRHSRANGRLDT
jgi:hypothetical protein